MKNLEYYEIRERNLTTQYFKTFSDDYYAYNFTEEDSHTGYDGTYTHSETDPSTFFEVKVRSYPIEKYPDYIIEYRKVNSLATWYNTGYPVKYMNFFQNSDGTYGLIVFDLDYRIQQWRKMGIKNVVQKKWMRQYTCYDRGSCTKEVIMIANDAMIDLKYTGYGWSLN